MIAASSPRHKGILGYPLPLTLAPYSLKLWVPGHWLRPVGAAQVVRWWGFQSFSSYDRVFLPLLGMLVTLA